MSPTSSRSLSQAATALDHWAIVMAILTTCTLMSSYAGSYVYDGRTIASVRPCENTIGSEHTFQCTAFLSTMMFAMVFWFALVFVGRHFSLYGAQTICAYAACANAASGIPYVYCGNASVLTQLWFVFQVSNVVYYWGLSLAEYLWG